MFTVYIIYSGKIDKYYIGFSADIAERLLKHNRSVRGFSSTGKPWSLVYTEHFRVKKNAMEREKQLKNWKNRERLIALIKKGSEHPD
jgi:putative endonuclease